MKRNKILQGDALTKLKELKEKSVNMCITSPPYWALRDYGVEVDNIWDGNKDCKHKFDLKKFKQHAGRGGISKIGYHKLKENVPDDIYNAGFCLRCGAWKGQLGLEPTFDLYIKHLCDIFEEVKRVLKDEGTIFINLGDTYSGTGSKGDYKDPKYKEGRNGQSIAINNKTGFSSKCLMMIPQRFAIEMINRGWILRNIIIWNKPNCMPSSVRDRFTVDFEYIFFFSKKKKYYFKQQLEPTTTKDNNVRDRDKTKLNNTPGRTRMAGLKTNNYHFKNKRTTWRISPKPFKEAHFAVYPEELCETPIKAGCSEGGTVLDPFFGAGTTGVVALKQGKKFIGIELNPEYIEIAKKRLKPYMEQTKLI